MKQYISKSALVAEIERFIFVCDSVLLDKDSLDSAKATYKARKIAYLNILSFLDTLEVKEVDLEKETTHYLLYEHRSPLNEIMHKADLKSEMQYHKDIENAFKAGFELGMQVSNKAQKGE